MTKDVEGLPDGTYVVRGGQNRPEDFVRGAERIESDGRLFGVSVNAAPEASVVQLTAPDPAIGFIGILHNRVGVSLIEKIQAAGGRVTPDPTANNPYHAILDGLTAEQASSLFSPTVKKLPKG